MFATTNNYGRKPRPRTSGRAARNPRRYSKGPTLARAVKAKRPLSKRFAKVRKSCGRLIRKTVPFVDRVSSPEAGVVVFSRFPKRHHAQTTLIQPLGKVSVRYWLRPGLKVFNYLLKYPTARIIFNNDVDRARFHEWQSIHSAGVAAGPQSMQGQAMFQAMQGTSRSLDTSWPSTNPYKRVRGQEYYDEEEEDFYDI